jgi:3-oxoacid CoA-transferase subunit A
MIYITGDTHADFRRVALFNIRNQTKTGDMLIILGDVGINYLSGESSARLKTLLANEPLTLFCIHGNHENRPSNLSSYVLKDYNEGKVYVEEEFPNILFPKDGEVFDIDGYKCLIIGGAYSTDRYLRMACNYPWWPDEQPTAEIRADVEEKIRELGGKVDLVFSHTCPRKYIPFDHFDNPDKDAYPDIDFSTEDWLDKIEESLDYKKWFCGHFHIEKKIDRMQFFFENIEVFREVVES